MARRTRTKAPTTTSLVASAVRLPVVRPNQVRGAEGWQGQAWSFYDRIGELRFVANWVGNVLSRAELLTVHQEGRESTEVESGPPSVALDAYFDGEQGQSEMLRQSGIHLTVAGECYHVYRASEERWSVLACGKVKQVGDKQISVDYGDGAGPVTLGSEDIAIRVWTPHPMNPTLADSPTRAVLMTLAEIERCDLHIAATLQSRLAGAGILFIPQDITFPIPEGADPNATSADVFMQVLATAMMTPLGNPGDPSAVVPVVVTAPGESLSQIKHQTFWTELDQEIREMRESAVKRLALGMDIPPEVLMGIADTNHWNAWLVDEASVKAHTEPRLAVVANAISTAYLQPALEGEVEDPKSYFVAGDTSNIRLRPNRSKEALELWDRGELGSKALLRETGFEIEDAPESHEFEQWLLRKIALGSTSPEQTQAAIQALGTPIVVPALEGTPAQGRPSDQEPRRSLEDHPVREIPDESMLAACDVLVYRALERAGNRLKSATNFTGKVQAADIYMSVQARPGSVETLMDGAWSCSDRVLADLTDDVPTIVASLDGYVRHLLMEQAPHTKARLSAVLSTQRGTLAVG